MSDDRQFRIEEQRARMQNILQNCQCAILIAVDAEGELCHAYMNMSPIERRGMIELLGDTAPRVFSEDDDDAE